MRARVLGVSVVLLLSFAAIDLWASGQAGVYAVVERVVFEPATGPPERVQVWGAFALMERRGQGFTEYVYRKPVRGYMYFKLPPEIADVVRVEWKDLASVAGKPQAVAFGYWDYYRGEREPTVRQPEWTPASPDVYLTNIGVAKLGPGAPGGTVDELLKLARSR